MRRLRLLLQLLRDRHDNPLVRLLSPWRRPQLMLAVEVFLIAPIIIAAILYVEAGRLPDYDTFIKPMMWIAGVMPLVFFPLLAGRQGPRLAEDLWLSRISPREVSFGLCYWPTALSTASIIAIVSLVGYLSISPIHQFRDWVSMVIPLVGFPLAVLGICAWSFTRVAFPASTCIFLAISRFMFVAMGGMIIYLGFLQVIPTVFYQMYRLAGYPINFGVFLPYGYVPARLTMGATYAVLLIAVLLTVLVGSSMRVFKLVEGADPFMDPNGPAPDFNLVQVGRSPEAVRMLLRTTVLSAACWMVIMMTILARFLTNVHGDTSAFAAIRRSVWVMMECDPLALLACTCALALAMMRAGSPPDQGHHEVYITQRYIGTVAGAILALTVFKIPSGVLQFVRDLEFVLPGAIASSIYYVIIIAAGSLFLAGAGLTFLPRRGRSLRVFTILIASAACIIELAPRLQWNGAIFADPKEENLGMILACLFVPTGWALVGGIEIRIKELIEEELAIRREASP